MISRKLAPLAVVAASLALSGCVQRIMDFTVISTKNVEIPGTRGEKVEGEDIKSIVIVFPTGQPNIKAAVDNALEKGNGDVLIDGVISSKMWYIPYVFGQVGFVAEGTSLKTFPAGTAPVRRAPVIVASAAMAKKAAAAGAAAAPVQAVDDPPAAPAPAMEAPPVKTNPLDAGAPPPPPRAPRPRRPASEAAAARQA